MAKVPAPWPVTTPSRSTSEKQEPLHERRHDRDRDQEHADPEEETPAVDVHARRRGDDLTPAATPGDPQRCRRMPGRLDDGEDDQAEERREREQRERRAAEEEDEALRALGDPAAEEIGRARPEDAADRHRVAPVAPALRPLDRVRPLILHVRAGRPVEEGRLQLAPAALEVDPRIGGLGRRRVARDRLHDRTAPRDAGRA